MALADLYKMVMEKSPYVGAGIGGLAGLPFGLAPVGAAAGYGAGYAMRDVARNQYNPGKNTRQNIPQRLNDAALGSATSGLVGMGTQGLLMSLLSRMPTPTPIKVYRGGTPLDENQGHSRGISVSVDRKVAEIFRKGKEQFNSSVAGQVMGRKPGMNVVEEYQLSPRAKIATRNDIPDFIYKKYRDSNPVVNPEEGEKMLGNWARSMGFDAIDYRTLGRTSIKEAEIKILNRNVLLPIK